MNKAIFTTTVLVFSLFLSLGTFAQGNTGLTYASYFSSHSARYLPSKLGNDFNQMAVNLPHFHAFAGNNFINYGRFQDFNNLVAIDNAFIEDVINRLAKVNNATVGTEFEPLSVALALGKSDPRTGEPFLYAQMGFYLRAYGNAVFSREIVEMAYYGNGTDQFRGKQVDLGPFSVRSTSFFETYVGFAKSFQSNMAPLDHVITFKPAVRLRYLKAIHGVKADMSPKLFTQEDGRRINLENSYDINDALPPSGDSIFNGSGFGIDLGLGFDLMENLNVHTSLINLGGVRLKQNTNNFTGNINYDFEGVEVRLISIQDGVEFDTDTFEQFLEPEATHESFGVGLGAQFLVQAEYGMAPLNTPSGIDYYKHNFFFQYVQGFRNHLSSTGKPYVGIGYSHDFKHIVNAGANLGFGGYERFTMGFHLGFRGGPFRLGVSTSDILLLLDRRPGAGTDINLTMGLAFNKSDKGSRKLNLINYRRF